MIFVTVGTDVPFDRLVRVVDEWAGSRHRRDVFAQIGATSWKPAHVEFSSFLSPADFARRFAESRVVVAHAGMGTILSALQWNKPILVMPRRGFLGETRNDHQMATAKHLMSLRRVHVAMSEDALRCELDRVDSLEPRSPIGPFASRELIGAIREFIRATD